MQTWAGRELLEALGFRLGPFPGKMAEFRIWDHARAADEVGEAGLLPRNSSRKCIRCDWQVELWMCRRCKGDEPGLYCCLSLRPARGLDEGFVGCTAQSPCCIQHLQHRTCFSSGGLSDSTLDPSKALAAGHFFSDRGVWDGCSFASGNSVCTRCCCWAPAAVPACLVLGTVHHRCWS